MTHGHLSLHVLFRDIFIPATFVFPQHTYIHPLLHICCCYIFVIGILRNTSSLWFRYIFVRAAIVFPRHIPTLSTTYIQPLAFALLALALKMNLSCSINEYLHECSLALILLTVTNVYHDLAVIRMPRLALISVLLLCCRSLVPASAKCVVVLCSSLVPASAKCVVVLCSSLAPVSSKTGFDVLSGCL